MGEFILVVLLILVVALCSFYIYFDFKRVKSESEARTAMYKSIASDLTSIKTSLQSILMPETSPENDVYYITNLEKKGEM